LKQITLSNHHQVENMFGKLNDMEIDRLISRCLVGRIGCHANGVTYVVPISYAFDGNCIYAHSYDGMKLDLMKQNHMVCFQVDDTRDLANWQSAVCWGEFEELVDEKGQKDALRMLHNRILPVISSATMHITPEWPFPSGSHQEIDGVFFRIILSEKTGRFEQSNSESFYCT
jgi:uncharacterized protein